MFLKRITRHCGVFLALASLSNGQSVVSQTFDDTDPIIVYSGDWVHQTGVDGPYNGTQSFSNVADATFAFTWAGTGFSICAGLKNDRGTFSVTIGVLAGTGTQNAASATNDSPACVTVFDVDNLASTGHTVLVANTGTTGQFLTVDGITLQVAVATGTTSSISPASSSASVASVQSSASARAASLSSASSRSRASQSSKSSSSASKSSSSASLAANKGTASSTSSSSSSAGPIAGGVIGGVVALAALAALLWFCCFRKRRNNRREDELATNPFVSDLDTEENNDYASKSMSEVSGSPVLFRSTDSQQQGHSQDMHPNQPNLPPVVPYPTGRSGPSTSSNQRYSNQHMAPTMGGSGSRGDVSRRTSYASAFSSQPHQQPLSANEPVPQIPMSFSAARDQPSPFALPAFPTDVEETNDVGPPEEDVYGGLVDESEDEQQSGRARRSSEVDLVVTKAGRNSVKRKPVPQPE